MSPAGLGERKLCSGTAPSNNATALPSLLMPVTTRCTCGDAACCWPAAYPAAINATAATDNPTIRFISFSSLADLFGSSLSGASILEASLPGGRAACQRPDGLSRPACSGVQRLYSGAD